MTKMEFTAIEVQAAFERFIVWCQEREIPQDLPAHYMLMCEKDSSYQFKNRNTRNYLYINKEPSPFNL